MISFALGVIWQPKIVSGIIGLLKAASTSASKYSLSSIGSALFPQVSLIVWKLVLDFGYKWLEKKRIILLTYYFNFSELTDLDIWNIIHIQQDIRYVIQ